MARAANWRPGSLEERIDRLESLEQIRELPHRYALALDTRNIEDLVELFERNQLDLPVPLALPTINRSALCLEQLEQQHAPPLLRVRPVNELFAHDGEASIKPPKITVIAIFHS